MKTQLPLLICFVFGTFMAVQYFVPAFLPAYNRIMDYISVVTAFSIVLGVASVVHRHIGRMQPQGPEHVRHRDWPYSLAALVGLVFMLLIGFATKRGPIFQSLFNSILLPVQSTMFALLAFYLASAAFRSFRARSTDAVVLLVAAVVVMLGRLDEGARLGIPTLSNWILNGPNMVAKRAIVLGVGLGMTATALKVVLGIERSYLGSGKE
jgi:hypothetical protein